MLGAPRSMLGPNLILRVGHMLLLAVGIACEAGSQLNSQLYEKLQ